MFLILCLILPLTAQASNVEDSLVVGIQSVKTQYIDPLSPVERDMMSIYDLVYESLVTIDDNYLPQPLLCESWELTSSGRSWTFHMREGLVFSDGTPLTAYDVVATAEYILQKATDESSQDTGYYANLRYYVSSISAPDQYTVVVRAARSYYGLLYAMTFPVLPAAQLGQQQPLGSGPYVIESFQPGSYLLLGINTRWWKNLPQVREISFLMYDVPKSVIESYEYARVDTIFTRSIAAAQYRSGTSSLALDYRTNQLECLLMNHSHARLASENVRKAIRYVVDVDKLASNVYLGMVARTDTPFIPGTWMYNDSLDAYFVRNLDEAKRLLNEEGWGDSNGDGILDRLDEKGKLVNFTLTLYVYEEPENDVRMECANLIAEQLAQVGISVSISAQTFAGIQEKLSAGSFQLALVSYAMDVPPDPGFLLMTSNTGNYVRYRSTAMNDLFKQLRTCVSQSEYQQTLMDIQTQFAKDCPFICLFWRKGVVLTRKMYTTRRDVRELSLLRGIESFRTLK